MFYNAYLLQLYMNQPSEGIAIFLHQSVIANDCKIIFSLLREREWSNITNLLTFPQIKNWRFCGGEGSDCGGKVGEFIDLTMSLEIPGDKQLQLGIEPERNATDQPRKPRNVFFDEMKMALPNSVSIWKDRNEKRYLACVIFLNEDKTLLILYFFFMWK